MKRCAGEAKWDKFLESDIMLQFKLILATLKQEKVHTNW